MRWYTDPYYLGRAKCCPNYKSYVADRAKNGDKKLSTDTTQILFTVQKPDNPGPSNLTGEFGRIRLTRTANGMEFYDTWTLIH
jgi:hypothetical protein